MGPARAPVWTHPLALWLPYSDQVSLVLVMGFVLWVDGLCPSETRRKITWCSHSDHANHYYAWCHFTRGVFHFPGLATCNLEYHLVKFGGLWMWWMMHHSLWATLKLDTIERPWYLMIFGRGKEGKRSGGGEKETHAKPFVLLLSSSKMLVQAWAMSCDWNLWSYSGC